MNTKKRLIIKLSAFLCCTSWAWADVEIDETTFPDTNFRNWVLSQSYGSDSILTNSEIIRVKIIEVEDKGIQNLKGVEFFTALSMLNCKSNQLTELDISKNTKLIGMDCSCNQLTELDLSKNTKLEDLYCYQNKIEEVAMGALVKSLPTVSNGTLRAIYNVDEQNVMTTLHVATAKAKGWKPCYYNGSLWREYEGSEPEIEEDIAINAANFPDENFRYFLLNRLYDKKWNRIGADGVLTKEEIANITRMFLSFENIHSLKGIEFFTALTELDCDSNPLTTLDVSKNTKLINLYCGSCQLTELDVSGCTELTWLSCFWNQITSLDVSKNTKLTGLVCSENLLTALDLSKNTLLERLNCSGNQLKALNLSQNKAMAGLSCSYNLLTEIDVSNSPNLDYLSCSNNQLSKLNLLQNVALDSLFCGGNQLTELDLSKNSALRRLECGDNQLTELDLSGNMDLLWMDCGGNQLTTLDLSKNTKLEHLGCSGDQLKKLDLSQNTALISLWCSGRQLTELDVSKNTALTSLSCSDTPLTTLDVSKNTALTSLYCRNNQLTELDVSQNTALTYLYCNGNQLTELDVSQNTALTYLSCFDNQLTELDLSQNTALTTLDCYQNQIKGAAMDALVESLPPITISYGGYLFIIYYENEQNEMSEEQVLVAKAKGWTPRHCTGLVENVEWGYSYYNWEEYSGPDGIKDIESLIPDLSKGDEEIYDLSGRKIVNGKSSNSKLSRGINIIRMSDGTTKKVLEK